MLLLMLEAGMPIDCVLTADTGMEFPEMYRHWDKIDQVLYQERGIHLTILRHPKGFEWLMFDQPKEKPKTLENRAKLGVPPYGNGWPGIRVRWCTGQLKTHLIAKEVNRLKKEKNALHYVGIAADESARIKDEIYPLVEWGITEAQALKICYDRGFDWNGLYEIYHRCSCWCCPFQRIGELKNLRCYHPELWARLRELDKRALDQFGHSALGRFKDNWNVEQLEHRFAAEDAARKEAEMEQDKSKEIRDMLKGIQILAPCNFRATLEREKIDPLSGQTIYGPDGKPLTEKVKISPNRFKIAHVFDLSQTEGRELPQIGVSELSGDVAGYTGIYDRLTALSPLPVMQEAFERSAKGYTSFMENRIVIKPGMSQVQTIKTLVHEIAHAKLHQPQDLLAVPSPAEKRRKEVEAESIAYVVCQHFGIDTTDYSLAYVASWSKGTELAELKASLNVIHSTAGEIIDAISPPPPKLERTQEQRPRQKGNRRAQKTRR